MSLNELYVIIYTGKGTMLGRRAYKTLREAETYLRHFNSGRTKANGEAKYRIERYLPAPLKAVEGNEGDPK